ncbi:MAG: hypothetical protein RR356_00930 [Bacteroidales bacterium]
MKKNILFLLLAAILISCTQTKKTYYENGDIESMVEYRLGKENGKTIYYYQYSGRVKLVIDMKNGKKNGKLIRYYSNGNVEAKEFYQNDLLEGKAVLYNVRGDVMEETNYCAGVKNGKYTMYHDNGELKVSGSFNHDLYDEEWFYYDDRGLMVGEGKFKQGTGIQYAYDEKGNLARKSNFVNNVKNGEELYYGANGEITKALLFKDEKIVEVNGEPVNN